MKKKSKKKSKLYGMIETLLARLFVAVVAFVLVFSLVLLALYIVEPKLDTEAYEVSTVKANKYESLWSIGERYVRNEDSIKAWVEAVKELNEMDDYDVRENQHLKIYVEKQRNK